MHGQCESYEHRVHFAFVAEHLKLTAKATRGAGSTASPPRARSNASTRLGRDRPPGDAQGRSAQAQPNCESPPGERGQEFDLPRTITTGTGSSSATTGFEYDAFGMRVVKDTLTSRTVYSGELYERSSNKQTGTVTHQFRIFAGSRQIAQIEKLKSGSTVTRSVRYLHSDRLGSPTHVTDETGKLISQRDFGVFGLSSAPSATARAIDSGFTGHREDPDLGLINMRGRIYDPVLRQFLSADPFVQFPAYSQSWNRYSYVLNNPTRYTDPTGYQTGGSFNDGGAPDAGGGGNSGGSGSGGGGGVGPEGANSGSGAEGAGNSPHYGRDRNGDGGSNNGDSWFDEFSDYVADTAIDTVKGTVCGLLGGSWDCQAANAPVPGKTTEKRPSKAKQALGAVAGAMGAVGVGAAIKKGAAKPSPKFEPPTNAPQLPPTRLPEGWRVRKMPPTEQYPNGYWKLEKPMPDGSWQPINPSSMKPGPRPDTHVPLPPETSE